VRAVTARAPATSPAFAGHGLTGDRDRVEREREQHPDPERHLVRGYRRVALPGGDRRRHHEHDLQRQRAHEEPDGRGRGRAQACPVEPQADPGPASPAPDHHEVRGRASGLGDDRARRGPGQAPVQPEDEHHVQADVRGVRGDGHRQRRPGVLQPAQHTGPGEDHQHGRRAEQADAQVRHRTAAHGRRGAEDTRDLRRERPAHGEHDDPDRRGQPDPVDALPDRFRPPAGADLARDRGRGPVGQEDRDVDERAQRLAGDPEAAERDRADPADDRRVGQQEQRLGDQRAERGHREPQDVPVLPVEQHAPLRSPRYRSVGCRLHATPG
jgi:hypothetical protein